MHRFVFENLDAYQLAVSVALWIRSTPWPRNTSHLKDQGIRAADSMVLNIAEGMSRGGKPGANHLRIARGSAGEVFAVLQLAGLEGASERQQELRRIGAMLSRLRAP